MPDTPRQKLLDALPLAALIVATDERIAGLNSAADALLGPGLSGSHYITALRQPDLLDAIEQALATHQSNQARYLSQDESEREAIFQAQCTWLDLPGIQGVLVSFEDRSHLQQASQMRRDFVANVSHELRTPLTSLLGFIETLRGPARDDAAARQRFLGVMQDEAARMERLVSELLSLSRVESQERERPTDPVDLAALARSVLHSLDALAKEAGVALHQDLPDAPLVVAGDEDQLRQVITNLVENAVKYGGAGGEVILQLRASTLDPALRSSAAILKVKDRGAGIDRFHIPRLTERFYRVDSHRSREVGGTGLGLAIVKHIVSRHRGRLRIKSRPGKGSVFTVILPA
jgi:two-component system phosphate regulon sensor histidine kinase PhoR